MRQYITVFVLAILFTSNLSAQGIEFTDAKWEKVLAQAQKENKIIFVDAYTTWCGPCKKMSSQVFTSKKLVKFYNDKFINVKMDMEKPQGRILGDKYNVFVYPTLLYIDGKGSLVHRTAGYQKVDQLFEEGNVALDPAKSLGSMDAQYAAGERDPAFLKEYLKTKAGAMDGSTQEIAEEYLATQTDWSEPDNLSLIFNLTDNVDSKMFGYLVQNKDVFIKQYGVNDVESKIQQMVFAKIHDESAGMNMEQIGNLFYRAYPSTAAKMTSQYRMTYTRERGDREGFANAAIDHYKKYETTDPGELNDVAWTFYEVIDDPKLLKGATCLAKKSIKLEKGYYNTDTLAALYYKMGKKGKAIKTAKKAIVLAKEGGEDFSTTTELIERIMAEES